MAQPDRHTFPCLSDGPDAWQHRGPFSLPSGHRIQCWSPRAASSSLGQYALASRLAERERCTALTRVNVAVTHGVDGVLALAIPLAEDRCSQVAGRREGGGVRNVTHIDHLVGSVQCLETPLVFLPEELGLGAVTA